MVGVVAGCDGCACRDSVAIQHRVLGTVVGQAGEQTEQHCSIII